MKLIETTLKAVGLLLMAVAVLMIAALAMLGACTPAPAGTLSARDPAPFEQGALKLGAVEPSCVWDRDVVGCSMALRLPFAGPIIVGCAISRVQGQDEIILGASCGIFTAFTLQSERGGSLRGFVMRLTPRRLSHWTVLIGAVVAGEREPNSRLRAPLPRST